MFVIMSSCYNWAVADRFVNVPLCGQPPPISHISHPISTHPYPIYPPSPTLLPQFFRVYSPVTSHLSHLILSYQHINILPSPSFSASTPPSLSARSTTPPATTCATSYPPSATCQTSTSMSHGRHPKQCRRKRGVSLAKTIPSRSWRMMRREGPTSTAWGR